MTNLNTALGNLSLFVTLGFIAGFVILLYLLLRSGQGYSVHDTQAHSTLFAGGLREGHGGMTAFLWVTFAAMFIWTVVYLAQHASEYAIIFASGG